MVPEKQLALGSSTDCELAPPTPIKAISGMEKNIPVKQSPITVTPATGSPYQSAISSYTIIPLQVLGMEVGTSCHDEWIGAHTPGVWNHQSAS